MPIGRQRSFDKQKTITLAMNLFWKKGFIGASFSELTQAMGINKPSMYAAFGNKEASATVTKAPIILPVFCGNSL